MADKNPILYYIGEIAIKKTNQLSIALSEEEMVRFARTVISTGLSIPKLIALQGMPCQKCGNDNILIPRGLMSTKRESCGGNISTRKKKKDGQ